MDSSVRTTSPQVPKVYLVGIASVGETPEQGEELLVELEELVSNLGWEILGQELVVLRKINSEFFVGSGK
ncbi:MAG TPA: hypothetical protein PLV25_08030, partial [Opitutales bacterium]|nr:hypothetical protein [Opitutales bacterium]